VDSSSDNQIPRRLAKVGDPPYGGVDSDKHAIMPKFGDGHNLLITGSTHDERGFRKTSDSEAHDKLIRRITAKVQDARQMLDDFIISGPESADWGIISFGSTSRSVEELMVSEGSGLNMRTMRLRTVWPFPDQAIRDFRTVI